MSKKTTFGFSTIELLIILVIAGILSAFIASKYSQVQQKSRDDQRRADINSLQFAVQSYFAQTGKYPTTAQLNDAAFRKKNLPTLSDGAIRDPKWTPKNNACSSNGNVTLENFTPPTGNCYGYSVSPVNCDNKNTACTSYHLSARLEGGDLFSKSSSG